MKTVVIGTLGTTLDRGDGPGRWDRWRPTVALCQHEDLLIHRLELLHDRRSARLARTVVDDIATASPETQVVLHTVNLTDPWDFEEVYGALHDFARAYSFDTDKEDYLIHITTGTHVIQICEFLLTESHHLPAKLIQTSPPPRHAPGEPGRYTIIDLDLSKYDRIATRFQQETRDDISFLKSGIETRSPRFNALIERIEHVALQGREPILLMGPTGAGKSQLAHRIFELKKARHKLKGGFVEINCATLRSDTAMSALFGHTRGAFTGAVQARGGLLKAADGGILFLDEIGALGPDEQAMLLRAVEEKSFLPVGADREVHSDFQLICGTNCNLYECVAKGTFREDLLARIDLWTFTLPGLKERHEDIEPNVQYELDRFARTTGVRVTFNKEAKQRFLDFATSGQAQWRSNFRDLIAAITRMATLAPGARITQDVVDEEIARLRAGWSRDIPDRSALSLLLSEQQLADLDRFDRVQLEDVVQVCAQARSLSDAGRILFGASRSRKARPNDADRLCKYLARYGLFWNKGALCSHSLGGGGRCGSSRTGGAGKQDYSP